jgi:hypothetical protein
VVAAMQRKPPAKGMLPADLAYSYPLLQHSRVGIAGHLNRPSLTAKSLVSPGLAVSYAITFTAMALVPFRA